MANSKKGTTLTLPTALIDQCKQTYQTENQSQAINTALSDYLLLPYDEQILDSFAIHQLLPDIEDRKTAQGITLRLDSNLRKIMDKLSKQDTLSETAQMMISRTLYAKQRGLSVSSNTSLLYILGNKRNSMMQAAIKNIKDTAQDVNWQTSVETCAGVLGIYANFKFADKEIVNDNDWRKINLYRAIQENPRKLVILARALNVDSATFNVQMSLLDATEHTAKVNYEAAAAYLYLNRNSYLHNETSLDTKASQQRYHKVLEAIAPLHQRMNQTGSSARATRFQNMDLLKIIEKYRRQKNVLFIVDPPYLDTDYYNNKAKSDDAVSDNTEPDDAVSDNTEPDDAKFGDAEHEELAHLLYLAKKNNGNDFIYFCRITAAKRDQKKPNAEEWDRHMKGRIDDMYHGHGFYYMDVDLDDATTERIITSFDFEDAKPYGREVR